MQTTITGWEPRFHLPYPQGPRLPREEEVENRGDRG